MLGALIFFFLRVWVRQAQNIALKPPPPPLREDKTIASTNANATQSTDKTQNMISSWSYAPVAPTFFSRFQGFHGGCVHKHDHDTAGEMLIVTSKNNLKKNSIPNLNFGGLLMRWFHWIHDHMVMITKLLHTDEPIIVAKYIIIYLKYWNMRQKSADSYLYGN